MPQIKDVNALESSELSVRIMNVYFFFPLLDSVGQRLQVWVSCQYFFEADAGCSNRQIRLFQVGKRIDIGIVHWSAQERHQWALYSIRQQLLHDYLSRYEVSRTWLLIIWSILVGEYISQYNKQSNNIYYKRVSKIVIYRSVLR